MLGVGAWRRDTYAIAVTPGSLNQIPSATPPADRRYACAYTSGSDVAIGQPEACHSYCGGIPVPCDISDM